MSDLITLTINGKTVQAKDGDVILDVARANDIFVPAVCYLTRCSPTLACRLCLVEADGKQFILVTLKQKRVWKLQQKLKILLKKDEQLWKFMM